MKRTILIALAATLIVAIASGFTGKKDIEGNGKIKVMEISQPSFNQVVIDGVFNVVFKQGNEGIVIEADENLFDLITVDCSNGILTVGFKKGFNLKKSTKINLLVSYKKLNSLKMNGVGNIKCDKPINATDFVFEWNGVGKATMQFVCTNLDASLSGVGEVQLSGSCGSAKISHSGVGSLDARELIAKNVTLDQSGVGSAKVFASESLDINASGIGSVGYAGNPRKITKHISGLSKVNQID